MENIKNLMWSSIGDMPIHNWFKLSKDNDFNQLLIVHSKMCNKDNVGEFEERSRELTQEYLDTFGADQDSEMLLVFLKSKIRLLADLIITGRKFLKIQIEMIDNDIKKLLPEEQDKIVNSLGAQLVRLTKYMGSPVKAKETTVVEYKNILLMLEEENKKSENGRATN